MRNKARLRNCQEEKGGGDRMTKCNGMQWNLRLDPGGLKGFRNEGVQSGKVRNNIPICLVPMLPCTSLIM